MKPASLLTTSAILAIASARLFAAEPRVPTFRAVEIDSKIGIGYGITVADVDGDKKPDILLVDKDQVVWYQNPTWKKHVIAEKLTPKDHVCIAAADIDGDGKAEIAVGAEWNPGDTENSGAVFYLIPPADRTQKWEAVKVAARTYRPSHALGKKHGGQIRFSLLFHCTAAATKTASVTVPKCSPTKCPPIRKTPGRRNWSTTACT